MFEDIRNGWLGKKILALLVLVFLNSSIDAPDIFSKTIAYNEQESILELILEKGLGFEDAIDEQSHDHELPEKSASKKIPLDLYCSCFSSKLLKFNFDFKEKSLFAYFNHNHSQNHSKIIIPPPEFRV